MMMMMKNNDMNVLSTCFGVGVWIKSSDRRCVVMRNCEPWFSCGADVPLGAEGNCL